MARAGPVLVKKDILARQELGKYLNPNDSRRRYFTSVNIRIDAPLCKMAGKIPSEPADFNLEKDLTAYQTAKRIVMKFSQNM